MCVSASLSGRQPGAPWRRNQYLLVVPSEESDFTIRSACSPHTHSHIKHHKLTGHVMHRCSPLMKEIMLNSKYNKQKSDPSHGGAAATLRQQGAVEGWGKAEKGGGRQFSPFISDVATYRNGGKIILVLGWKPSHIFFFISLCVTFFYVSFYRYLMYACVCFLNKFNPARVKK